MPSQEQLEDTFHKASDVVKANVATLNDAGLFRLDNVIRFSKDLAAPIKQEYFTAEGFQTILLARVNNLEVRAPPPRRRSTLRTAPHSRVYFSPHDRTIRRARARRRGSFA